jgi:glutathione S-transferase
LTASRDFVRVGVNREVHMLTIHHAPKSRSSRILWLLEELGAPYAVKITDIARQDGSGGHDPANPHPDKKVPAIVDDGVLISESAAIVLYLTDKFSDAGIGPKIGDALRGPYLTWLAYYAGVIEPVITLGFNGLGDNDKLRRVFTDRAAVDRRILTTLQAGPYILGQKFSGADILIASTGQFHRGLLPEGGIVDEYLARCNARPALAHAMAKDAG